MRAVVTGGAGFIGSNLVDALLARGDQVAVIDDLSAGKLSNLEQALATGASFHQLDIRDGAGVDELFAQLQPQVVFHLAAQMDVRRSLEDPAFDASVNVVGTINLLQATLQREARSMAKRSSFQLWRARQLCRSRLMVRASRPPSFTAPGRGDCMVSGR